MFKLGSENKYDPLKYTQVRLISDMDLNLDLVTGEFDDPEE